ncbi:MAG: HD domain-containing phosphohydrolase [Candidatus Caldatribacteriaceae bacterium]
MEISFGESESKPDIFTSYISLLDFVIACSETADLMDPSLHHHQLKVGYLAYRIGEAMNLAEEKKINLLLAGLLHDMGAFSWQERHSALQFEFLNPHGHALNSYLLFKSFPPLAPIAWILRFHHFPWNNGAQTFHQGVPVPLESFIINLADRVSILLHEEEEPLEEIGKRVPYLEQHVPGLFHPQVFEAFMDLLPKEYIWFDFFSPYLRHILAELGDPGEIWLDPDGLFRFSEILTRLIDFRSSFTATHSIGVATVSRIIGEIMGCNEKTQIIFISGLLHDLGKVAIPREILEKPGPLNIHEANTMKRHPYYTHQILSRVSGLQEITQIAQDHHERLDGRGYPRKKRAEELSLESRIVAISDVLTALSEDRPYRGALTPDNIKSILTEMAKAKILDQLIVKRILENLPELTKNLEVAKRYAQEEYRKFRQELASLTI